MKMMRTVPPAYAIQVVSSDCAAENARRPLVVKVADFFKFARGMAAETLCSQPFTLFCPYLSCCSVNSCGRRQRMGGLRVGSNLLRAILFVLHFMNSFYCSFTYYLLV